LPLLPVKCALPATATTACLPLLPACLPAAAPSSLPLLPVERCLPLLPVIAA
jgi:hypothetical protein